MRRPQVPCPLSSPPDPPPALVAPCFFSFHTFLPCFYEIPLSGIARLSLSCLFSRSPQ